jgi:hypothetical protein
MTQFVSSFATDQLVPPWVSTGCLTWSFVVEVTEANVRNYLSKYFNGPYPDRAPYEYVPLPGPQFGLITFAQHPSIRSCAPGQPSDPLSFSEVLWTFPVRRYDVTTDNLLIRPQIVWVQPFSFCDNASVVFASREIWGADMAIATVEQQKGLKPDQLHIDVAIEGIRKFSPRSVSERLGCMHIEKRPGGRVNLGSFLKERPQMRGFARLVQNFRGRAGKLAPRTGGPMAAPELDNLKQFRDTCNMGDATYRAIVASRAWHTDVSGLAFYESTDKRKIDMDIMWSDSIAEMATTLLGVVPPQKQGLPQRHKDAAPRGDGDGPIDWNLPSAPIGVALAFSFRSNVHFQVIDTLYTYGDRDRAALRATSALKS